MTRWSYGFNVQVWPGILDLSEVDLTRVTRREQWPNGVHALRFVPIFEFIELVDGQQLTRRQTLQLRDAIEWYRNVGLL